MCGIVQSGTCADEGQGIGFFNLLHTPLGGERLRFLHFFFRIRFCDGGKVFRDWQEDRTLDLQIFEYTHSEVDDTRNIRRMTGDLAVPLHGMHITQVHTAARHFHRTDDHCTFAHTVDVHMAVRTVFKFFHSLHIVMRCIEQELAEVACVV